MIIDRHPALDFDPKAKAAAEESARFYARAMDCRCTVEYRDHYDDTRVSGEYLVIAQ